MNELAVRQKNLPAMPIEDVKKYVDLIGDAIDELKIKRNAASHLDCDKSIIEEMERQIREYSALKVKAQLEMGKRTARMETGFGNRFTVDHPTGGKSKTDQLATIGLAPQRASEYERMAENEEIVEQYIEDSLANEKAPTKSGALKAIDEKKSHIVSGEDSFARHSRPTPIQAAAKERDEKMNAAISRITSKEIVIEYSIDDLLAEIKANAERFESLFTTLLTIHKELISTEDAKAKINEAIDKYIINQFEELKGRKINEEIS